MTDMGEDPMVVSIGCCFFRAKGFRSVAGAMQRSLKMEHETLSKQNAETDRSKMQDGIRYWSADNQAVERRIANLHAIPLERLEAHL